MNRIIRAVKRWWAQQDHQWNDPLVEGWYADQYRDAQIRDRILAEYTARHTPQHTPWTHPQDYNPLTPPAGWRYDPYYEVWIKE